jgi:hypothetical protein
MNQLEILKKIEKLDEATILKMSPDVLAILTDNFEEKLLKKFVTKAETNEGQRKLIRFIKDSYKKWKKETDQFWGMLGHESYPDYLLNMQVAIECGEVMVDEEERRSKREELMSKIICQHEMMIASLDYMTDVELAKALELANLYPHEARKISTLEARIKELEEENQLLKEQSSQKQTADNQDDVETYLDEIESLKAEIEYLKKDNGKLTTQEAAILTITACYYGGGWNNRENLHPILTNLFGIPETHAKRRLREGIKNNDTLETLAKCFDEVSPKIAGILREMPEVLKNYKMR